MCTPLHLVLVLRKNEMVPTPHLDSKQLLLLLQRDATFVEEVPYFPGFQKTCARSDLAGITFRSNYEVLLYCLTIIRAP